MTTWKNQRKKLEGRGKSHEIRDVKEDKNNEETTQGNPDSTHLITERRRGRASHPGLRRFKSKQI